MKPYASFFKLSTLALVVLVMACTTNDSQMRKETAQRIAAPSWMVKRHIDAGSFDIMAYERMHDRYAPANVYIEGDGGALSVTPDNPVALRLASRDKADNLVYLARPCQYQDGPPGCADLYWHGSDFSADVIMGYNQVLNDIKRRYNIEGFNLIGHGGGGAIAALLAAERDDVLSLRSVGGILDHRAFSALHVNQTFENSLNPAEFGVELSRVPQYHFSGENDEQVPAFVFESYAQAIPSDHCLQHEVVKETDHQRGWVDVWPTLLKKTPKCGFTMPETILPDNMPSVMGDLPPAAATPIRVEREKPSKP